MVSKTLYFQGEKMPILSPTQPKSPQQLLSQIFGYQEFRGQQEAVIARILGGKSCLVLMPTGGGKSLCYQVPALLRDGMALVVSPLIALMQDQVAALKQNGVKAEFLNSSLAWEERAQIRERVS